MTETSHAAKRTERSPPPDRPRHADGPDVPAVLAARAAGRGAARERMPAGAGQAARRAAAGLARHAGPLCADRRVLRPSRRLAVVRPQRAQRAALPLSRLEVRPHRPVHRGAVRAERERLLPEDQVEVLSAGRARRRAVDLHGPAREAAAAAGVGVRHGAGEPQLHVEAAAGVATGCRRWKAASIPATSPSCTPASSTAIRCSRARRATPTTWAT